MNVVLQMFLDALGKYLQNHPDQVEKLVEAIVKQIIAALEAPKA